MPEPVSDIAKALAPWPYAQAGFLAIMLIGIIMAMVKASRDRKAMGNVEIPYFLLGGPVASVMEAIHDMAEESRKQTALLQRLVAQMDDMDHQRETTQKLLEEIRNYQALGSPSPGRRGRL